MHDKSFPYIAIEQLLLGVHAIAFVAQIQI